MRKSKKTFKNANIQVNLENSYKAEEECTLSNPCMDKHCTKVPSKSFKATDKTPDLEDLHESSACFVYFQAPWFIKWAALRVQKLTLKIQRPSVCFLEIIWRYHRCCSADWRKILSRRRKGARSSQRVIKKQPVQATELDEQNSGPTAGSKDEKPEKIIEATSSPGDSPKEEVDLLLDTLKDTCPFCARRFKDEKQVNRHIRRVHARPFKCEQCPRSYFSRPVLEAHRKTHISDFFVECSTCHIRYKREQSLKHHYARAHSDLEPKFVCDHCDKRYRLKMDLVVHIKRAHMANAEICRFCGKAVMDRSHHEWRHKQQARKNSFEHACNLCYKRFHSRVKLDNHLLLHKEGYRCEECDEVFRVRGQLGRHRSMKHKPATVCTICGKTFTSVSTFYQHVLTHAGIRPYKCDVCDEDFTQRSSLMRHRKKHPEASPPSSLKDTPIAELAKNVLQRLGNAQDREIACGASG
ncbi:hypothetical protein KM043_002509 [Ampulex compressa]|nr:hypothetical protein KM043_002509 [Ampulex compressa]